MPYAVIEGLEVTSNPDEHEEVVGNLNDTLRALAANLMRVVRGAGDAWRLPEDARNFVNAVVAYREVVGRMPRGSVMGAAIALRDPKGDGGGRGSRRPEDLNEVLRSALKVAAARQCDRHYPDQKHLQELKGEAELFSALERFQGLHS